MMPKFKAYDLTENEWINIRTLGLNDNGGLWYMQAWDENENDIDPPYFEDDLGKIWALMQSSGLTDYHYSEYFEGDIARDVTSEEIGVVEYVEGKFVMRFDGGDSVDLSDVKDEFEIIGNKFEDGYLLEED